MDPAPGRAGRPEDSLLHFGDLGTVAVDRAGVPLALSGRRLQAALSVLLIHANERVSVDTLVSALWGERAGGRREETLQSHMWRLRQALEPDRRRGEPFTTVVHDSSGYRLLATSEQVDSLRFGELAAEAQHLLAGEQARRALHRCDDGLALWRGRPFGPLADEEWAQATVARLEELRAQLTECRIESLLAVGEPEKALLVVEGALAEHPLRERLWAQRMVAAYRCGRTSEALQVFQTARRMLLDELGMEPGPELRDLQTRILAGDPALGGARETAAAATPAAAPQPAPEPSPPRPEVHLPGRLTPLVGRTAELTELTDLIRGDRLVTVVGPPGVGKTRIAIESARRLGPDYPDGVWFSDLTGARDGGQVVDHIGSTLGMSDQGTGTPATALRAYTRGRSMLLVLDNCEQVLADVADLVESLLAGGSELSVVATSREPLGVDGETVWPLHPLQTPDPIDGPVAADELRRLLGSPAVQLFVRRLAAADHAATVQGDDLRRVGEIVAAVDGLPLAIELAAAQGEAYTVAEIADRVSADPSDLSRVDRRGQRHHATVRDAVEWSYVTLPPNEAALHRAVSVVPGPFTAGLAAALLPDLRPAAARDALRGLLHRSLLSRAGPSAPGRPSRFVQLETVRAHAANAHPHPGEHAALEGRRDEWVAALVRNRPRLGHHDGLGWYGRLDDDLAAVRSTLEHTLAEQPSALGVGIASRLNFYWFSRGMSLEAGRWLALAVEHAGPADAFERTLALLARAAYCARTGRLDLADPLLRRAVTDPAGYSRDEMIAVGEWLCTFCASTIMAPHPEPFDVQAQQVRALAKASGDGLLALFADLSVGLAVDPYAEPAATLDAMTDVYVRARAAGDMFASRIAAGQATLAATVLGDVRLAMTWSDRTLQRHHDAGIQLAPNVADARANVLALAGANHAAVRLYAAARAQSRRFGMRWPTEKLAQKLSEQARSALSNADLQREQREGLRLSLADLDTVGLADENLDLAGS